MKKIFNCLIDIREQAIKRQAKIPDQKLRYSDFNEEQQEYISNSLSWWICQAEIDTIGRLIYGSLGSNECEIFLKELRRCEQSKQKSN